MRVLWLGSDRVLPSGTTMQNASLLLKPGVQRMGEGVQSADWTCFFCG